MIRQLFLAVSASAALLVAIPGSGETAFVAGASGRTGGYVLYRLQQAGLSAVGLSRDAKRASERNPGPWRWVEGDVRDPRKMAELVAGSDYLICAIGAPARSGALGPEFVDYGGVKNLVDAAIEAKVKHFVLISSAAAGHTGRRSKMIEVGNVRYWKTKGEDYLKASGLSYTIIGPGGLENKKCCNDGLRVLSRRDYTTGLIARGDVALIAVDALRNPDAKNKTFAAIRDDDLNPFEWRELLPTLGVD